MWCVFHDLSITYFTVFTSCRLSPTPNCSQRCLFCLPVRIWFSLSSASSRLVSSRCNHCNMNQNPNHHHRHVFPQNIMPISAAMFRSERKNPVPQCPPRLDVQMLTPVIWSRMPNHFLSPETGRLNEKLGWRVHCQEPLTMMALHIPEESRSELPESGGAEHICCYLFTHVTPLHPAGVLISWSCLREWTC